MALDQGISLSDHMDNKVMTPRGSLSNIEKVSLVKLSPLDNKDPSPLSPNTLTRLVEEQTKSHEAIEALQQRIQSETPNYFSSEVRKKLEQSALEQRQFLDQVISTPSTTATPHADISTTDQDMLTAVSSDATNVTPLAKRLFPNGLVFDDEMTENDALCSATDSNRFSLKRNSTKTRLKSDMDSNDTGVESDSSSDVGAENPSRTRDMKRSRNVFTVGGVKSSREGPSDDPLMLYLEAIERKALEMESLIEKAKLDTVMKIKWQMEAEFNGLPLEEIPSKCHQRIDRAIQRYLERELEIIRGEEGEKGEDEGNGAVKRVRFTDPAIDLENENSAFKEKIVSLEASVTRVDMLYIMQKKENDYLIEKVAKLERQMANDKLKYENELDDVKCEHEEDMRNEQKSFKSNSTGVLDESENSQKMTSLYEKLAQAEIRNTALKTAGDADQTTIRCLELKVSEMEEQLKNSKNEVSDLFAEIQELRVKEEQRSKKVKRYELQLKEVSDERHMLRETLIMSEHEITLLENKLGDENNSAWKDSKKEILEDLRKLEKHIKVIHREKRKLENRYLAFKIENENLTDSLHSLSRTKDILTPLGSCEVSRRESNMSSHSSSLSSSLVGSDVEDEGDGLYNRKSNSQHSGGSRRRRRGQDYKDKQFAEAVAKKLIFAQKAIKDQNCNFSSFENSGDVLLNETEELVKRVDSLTAEKRAIKMELESIRSTSAENVKV